MIESHRVEDPPWMLALIECVVDAMEGHEFLGQLGWRFWTPSSNDASEPFVLCVFPAPYEVSGGPLDGTDAVSGFTLDIGSLIAKFTRVDDVAWNMPTRYDSNLDGPSITFDGLFLGKHVKLRVFHCPPPDQPAVCVYSPLNGTVTHKLTRRQVP